MKERPILFSAPMVRALLDGSKTQTRRALRVQPMDVLPMNGEHAGREWVGLMTRDPKPEGTAFRCKFGVPGDRLWVRETFMDLTGTGVEHRDDSGTMKRFAYAADCPPGSHGDQARKDYGLKWKPSIHMPRIATRILLDVVSVRVERLNDCSETDAVAEGCTKNHNGYYWGGPHAVSGTKQMATACKAYCDLWESINGAGSWAANPWVWVIEFRKVNP